VNFVSFNSVVVINIWFKYLLLLIRLCEFYLNVAIYLNDHKKL